MMASKHDIVKDLLDIKAVQIKTEGYFTWTSGLKSPIYCDNRLTMSYPAVRRKIAKAFAEKIKELGVKPDVIAGCATAGIPHAAWLAEELDLPMVYVRSKPKAHGKGNQIEGAVSAGQKAIVIEDLISTGGSSIESAKALQAEGVEVIQVMAIFTYGLDKAKNNFAEAGLDYSTISGFDQLIDLLVDEGEITTADKEKLLDWRSQL
ncbi:orotate phosphoribosyltransferase [Aciduricibacillus chroicocephali]|uniref:Orotate phosphoribosyltransferase n=2 Tax=Aciduricibacillus chroicocephali TaxID=3054939 RepID=A0ABY9KY70_9BACI|nr:orotate phosphoribosyltransferase [Bacillaceae bacterium 44XB]